MDKVLVGCLTVAQFVLSVLIINSIIQSIYMVFLSFWGFGDAKRRYKLIDDKTRFLILVAAHNEEDVIGDTLSNLENIQYDSKLYDIYVINDNSTDNTRAICENMGASVINTGEQKFRRECVGKPGGIQYALRALGYRALKKKYDLIMILDADNYVDPTILSELNSQWQGEGKPEAIQTYLDSKNTTSILSIGYSTSYWVTNRFFQLAKYRLKLPNAIGGTGFAVRTDWLINHGGFASKSLTEDLELEINIIEDGGRILWNHFAGIYDEKPDSIKISMKQRTRWAKGHWFVAFTEFKRIVIAFFKKFKYVYIDQLLYLFSMSKGLMFLMVGLTSILLFLCGTFIDTGYFDVLKSSGESFLMSLLPVSVYTFCAFIFNYCVRVLYALYKDKKHEKVYKVFLGVMYYSTTFILAQLMGFIRWKNQKTWVKTPHKHVAQSIKVKTPEQYPQDGKAVS